MAYKWPTDGPSALPKHSIPWAQELANRKAKGATTVPDWAGGAPIPIPPPAPPAAAPQPYDPAYQGTVLTANRNVTLGNNEATYQTQQTGYDLGYDQTGAFNAANPYSQAQLLQDSYHDQQRGTTNNLANAGQLYAGSLINQRGIDDRNYSISDAALKRRAQATYHGIQAGQLQNYATNAVGVSDAGFNKLRTDTYGGS